MFPVAFVLLNPRREKSHFLLVSLFQICTDGVKLFRGVTDKES